MNDYYKIGKIAATRGVAGQLVLTHSLGQKTSFEGLESLLIETSKDSFLPYFIVESSVRNTSETLLVLEGISSKEAARFLLKKEVWLTRKDFKKFAASSAPISLLGYTIICDKEEVGEIIEVIEQPHQLLCKILLEGKEALIPLHQDSLLKNDKKNRRLYVDIPEGLLDIYRDA